jgi:hypothetical protein
VEVVGLFTNNRERVVDGQCTPEFNPIFLFCLFFQICIVSTRVVYIPTGVAISWL